ncbi:hypothetical protein L208DRAFT_1383070 [Tricholoma matsutake]|nr:hypothetical protein L208DRAFT_1383070 [Tricholoma matsutake 945]
MPKIGFVGLIDLLWCIHLSHCIVNRVFEEWEASMPPLTSVLVRSPVTLGVEALESDVFFMSFLSTKALNTVKMSMVSEWATKCILSRKVLLVRPEGFQITPSIAVPELEGTL